MDNSLNNKTLLITGASRGIGLGIALKAARDGANVLLPPLNMDPMWLLRAWSAPWSSTA